MNQTLRNQLRLCLRQYTKIVRAPQTVDRLEQLLHQNMINIDDVCQEIDTQIYRFHSPCNIILQHPEVLPFLRNNRGEKIWQIVTNFTVDPLLSVDPRIIDTVIETLLDPEPSSEKQIYCAFVAIQNLTLSGVDTQIMVSTFLPFVLKTASQYLGTLMQSNQQLQSTQQRYKMCLSAISNLITTISSDYNYAQSVTQLIEFVFYHQLEKERCIAVAIGNHIKHYYNPEYFEKIAIYLHSSLLCSIAIENSYDFTAILLLCKHFTLKTSVTQDTINVLKTLLMFVQEIAFKQIDYTFIKQLMDSGPNDINIIVQKTQEIYDDLIQKGELGVVKNEQLFRIQDELINNGALAVYQRVQYESLALLSCVLSLCWTFGGISNEIQNMEDLYDFRRL